MDSKKDVFVLRRNIGNNVEFQTCRIRKETYELINYVKELSGISFCETVDAMARFCCDLLVVEEPISPDEAIELVSLLSNEELEELRGRRKR